MKYINSLQLKKSSFLFFFVFLSLLIDIANGFLKLNYNLETPISQMYKSILLIFFLLVMISNANSIKHLTIIFFCFFLMTINIFTSGESLVSPNFTQDIIYTFKKLTILIVYFGAIVIFEKVKFDERQVVDLYKLIFFAIFFSLLLSILGYGETQYGLNTEGVAYGYKGYFFAGNELTSLFTVSYSFLLYYYLVYKKSIFSLILIVIFGILTSLLLATKTAIFSVIAILVFLPILIKYHSKISRDSSILIKYYYISFIPIGLLLFNLFLSRIQLISQRFEFLYNQQGNSITAFLLSGRNYRYESLFEIYQDMNVVDVLFGIGREAYVTYTFGSINRFSAEMDLLDSFFSHGIIGTIIIFGFWLYMFYFSIKTYKQTTTPIAAPQLLCVILLFANSFVAGHIFASSMVMVFFGFSIAFVHSKIL